MDREPLRDADLAGSCFPDENNNSGATSFEELSQAFSQKVTDLQQLMCLRIEGALDAACPDSRRVQRGAGGRCGAARACT